MASYSDFLVINPGGGPLVLSPTVNSFVSNWGDKRSSTAVGISVVFYGANTPAGTCTLQVSNAPITPGQPYAGPNKGGDDAALLASSSQAVALNSVSGLYGCNWQIVNCPARFIRVNYVASSNVSGLSVNVYVNAPYESA